MSKTLTDFLIVTALEEERDAILNKLPNYKQLPPSEESVRFYYSADISTRFSNGTVDIYTVAVVMLLNMGRVEAAIATGDAIRQWNPRYVIMVGIAGGISESNVRLGDILVSDQVVDYELQKITSTGPKVRYSVHRANPRLHGATQSLKIDRWQALIQEQRPSEGQSKRLIGPVATGDKVIAFGDVLNQYRDDWPKLIGVEMEAGGVASAAFQSASQPGFFMVRGVSDLADADKDNVSVLNWRAYACDVAASYVIALLQNGPVPPSTLQRNQPDIEPKSTSVDVSNVNNAPSISPQSLPQDVQSSMTQVEDEKISANSNQPEQLLRNAFSALGHFVLCGKDLDKYYVNRPNSPLRAMKSSLLNNQRPVKLLFSGYQVRGKRQNSCASKGKLKINSLPFMPVLLNFRATQ